MPRGRFVQNAQRRYARAQSRARGRTPGVAGARGRPAPGLGAPAPMPWDSTAQREASRLGNEAADTRAGLGGEFSRVENELGFGSGADNPYSQAAALKQQHEANRRGITNTAGNQLYAGSTVNKQSAARSQYDTGEKRLEDSYAEAQAAYNRGLGRTARDESQGMLEIKEGAIGRALESDPEPLAVSSGRTKGRGRTGFGARPGQEGQNIRRPGQARVLNSKARAINAQLNRRRRGR